MREPAVILPARLPSSAAAARSVVAGSPRFAPNPTYARFTPTGALFTEPLYVLLTFADGLDGRPRVGPPTAPSSRPQDGAMSTLMELTVVLVLCPAALAIWADARYP